MKKTILFLMLLCTCAVLISGCAANVMPTVTPTATPTATPTGMPEATATSLPTPAAATTTPTATAYPASPTPAVEPTVVSSIAPGPAVYTVSCIFTTLVINSTDTVITGIDGRLTDTASGKAKTGSADADAYRFTNVAPGRYDLAISVQYTVYYQNNTTEDGVRTITDSFDVNGNVDKTYLLKQAGV